MSGLSSVQKGATVFVRLTESEGFDKGEVLASAINALAQATLQSEVFIKDPSAFKSIPGSTLPYWAEPEMLSAFERFEPFENSGRMVRVGLQSNDDFRFLRLCWEPLTGRLLDLGFTIPPSESAAKLKAAAHMRTAQDKPWVPHAKGGDYSPFFSDLNLVINWGSDGAEVREKARQIDGSESRSIRSTNVYFLPGVTWTQRTQSGLNARALPAGTIHGTKGSSLFSQSRDDLLKCLAIMNSEVGRRFAEMLTTFGSYGEGVIKRIPFPSSQLSGSLGALALTRVLCSQRVDRNNETSHSFSGGSTKRLREEDERCDAQSWKSMQELDREVANSFGFRHSHLEDHKKSSSSQEVISIDIAASEQIGLAFGRWDIRIAKDQSLAPQLQGPFDPLPVCAPATLVGPDGLPARSGGIASEAWLRARPDAITLPPEGSFEGAATIADEAYPLPVPWDGLLIDDVDVPDHPDGPLTRVRAALAVLHGDEAPEVERQLAEGVGARSLADYLRRPGGFFADHLARYSKSRRQAPIYWPLSTPSGSFTVWVYYPRLTSDTLYRIDNQYLQPKLATLDREIEEAARELPALSGRAATQQRERLEERTARREELLAFRQELLRVAGLPFRPDHDDGVILCAAPLWRLFRLPKWARATRETWEKLERGDYDWAHLAMAIWPERVLEKCRTDRSLAIAHDREDRYVAPPPGAGKKGKRAAALPLADDEEDDS